MQAEGLDIGATAGVEAFVVPLGTEAKRLAVRLVGQLRDAGISADTVYGGRGLKGSMKAADEPQKCPKCGSEKTARNLSVFAVSSTTGGPSSSDAPMCGRCGGAPGSCAMD